MNLYKLQQQRTISRLYRHNNLLDVLIDVEGLLDNFNIYVYDNWFKGEIFEGPYVRRYWIVIVLKYDAGNMPDPQGGLILTKHGCKVEYKKSKKEEVLSAKNPRNIDGDGEVKTINQNIWLVKLTIPRKYIISDELFDLEDLDDELELDLDTIEQAQDEGIDEETGLEPEEESTEEEGKI